MGAVAVGVAACDCLLYQGCLLNLIKGLNTPPPVPLDDPAVAEQQLRCVGVQRTRVVCSHLRHNVWDWAMVMVLQVGCVVDMLWGRRAGAGMLAVRNDESQSLKRVV